MTGPTCVGSVSEVLLRPTKTPLFNLGHSFGHSWPISRLFRATSYFCNILMYRELAWLRGRDLNPRPLGYENKVCDSDIQ